MDSKAIVLLVDDVASNIHSLATILEDNYAIKVATSGKRALELTCSEPMPDLILLDIEMPLMDGYEVLKKLKADTRTKHIPVIFVTASTQTEDEQKGLELGAVDYITKPLRPAIVQARVRTQITIKLQQDELVRMALRDKLTGLYNRHYLTEMSRLMFANARRHEESMSIIMCDLDNFKSVNDTYGHLKGDKVLQQMGSILLKEQRSEDFVARYGGEEFLLVLGKCNAKNAKEKAEKIRIALAEQQIDGIKVTASFGVAQLSKQHVNFNSLLQDADTALFKAKETGRNKTLIH